LIASNGSKPGLACAQFERERAASSEESAGAGVGAPRGCSKRLGVIASRRTETELVDEPIGSLLLLRCVRIHGCSRYSKQPTAPQLR
jgi:hypothetical protein